MSRALSFSLGRSRKALRCRCADWNIWPAQPVIVALGRTVEEVTSTDAPHGDAMAAMGLCSSLSQSVGAGGNPPSVPPPIKATEKVGDPFSTGRKEARGKNKMEMRTEDPDSGRMKNIPATSFRFTL
ncbi:hypothetical protein POX_b02459 [Penicillium oxalicum]|uniref:hypothetical protein n=1 Tax=Penicillium oxalicum TaxID=69781 RepID=UPI0020B65B9D|nr:hypothetical protein POX_b02459 [Penicillium oxalicum]KAI2792421.1 hypothetical protein POX_b02459 [Penicillium oxalicum]